MTWKHSTTAEEAATVLKDHINGKNSKFKNIGVE